MDDKQQTRAFDTRPQAETPPAPEKADQKTQVWRINRADPDPARPERPGGAAARGNTFANKVWRPYLHPVVALLVICLVTSLLLGLTNSLTAPIIEENTRLAAEAARKALLPQADAFEPMPVDGGAPGVTAMYRAANGAGYIVEAEAAGYGGKVPAIVAFDAGGTILGVSFPDNSETPGLGKKLVTEGWFAEQFAGKPSDAIASASVDRIANATVSSNAAVAAINAAIEQFNAAVLGEQTAQLTPEEVVVMLADGQAATPITLDAEGVLPGAYKLDGGGFIIYGQGQGVHGPVTAAVAMDGEGTVTGLWLDTSDESEGYGRDVDKNTTYMGGFVGAAAPVQVQAVAGATLTSNAVAEAVNNALAALAQAKEAG